MAMGVIPDGIKVKEEEYRQLLMRLSGVFAANVQLNVDGSVTEIHILGSSLRNPKQIMRDVQSALASSYGISVDHRVISIAQLREDPVPEEDDASLATNEVRLLVKAVTESVSNNRYSISLTLTQQSEEFSGTASSFNTPAQRPKAVASAVLQAVHEFLGIDNVFSLLDVQTIQVSSARIAIVAVEVMTAQASPVLVGAVDTIGGDTLSIARAVLDAINRKIAWLVAHPS